jgi:hypothetical protein
MPSRSGRVSHVRPRQPSGQGRREPLRVPAPDSHRLRRERGLDERRTRMPLPSRLLLAVAVVALAGVVLLTAGGTVGSLVKALGTSLGGLLDGLTATPTPSASVIVVADSPVIASPREPYTNTAEADLVVTIPRDAAGDRDALVRVYLALEGVAPSPITEVPVGATTRLVVPVTLTVGRNDFSATLVRSGVESESSPIVTYILDQEPPAVVLTSPRDGATINDDTVTLEGRTQPRSDLVVRNEANGTSITGEADSDGSFELVLPLAAGPNGIRLTATDPAGNQGELIVNVLRGSGKLTAVLSASAYRISVGSLPTSLQVNVLVTDPNGAPLEGADVTFTITVPGIPPIVKETVTAGDGRASFSTTLGAGVETGGGLLTVTVTTQRYGSTTDQRSMTFVS